VVDLNATRRARGEREDVGRRHQVHGLSMSVGDLMAVDRGLTQRIHHRGDLEPAPLAEMFTHPPVGDRPHPLDPGGPGPAGVHEQPHRGQELRLVDRAIGRRRTAGG
jgi:hypothetical protein